METSQLMGGTLPAAATKTSVLSKMGKWEKGDMGTILSENRFGSFVSVSWRKRNHAVELARTDPIIAVPEPTDRRPI